MGVNAILTSTAVGFMANGLFVGEVNAIRTTMDGDAVMLKGTAAGYPTRRVVEASPEPHPAR